MTQLWSTLLTFLFAHTQLGRWFGHVFDCLTLFDDVLANPDEMLACRSAQGRRRIEAYIARCEDWIQFLIQARAAEIAGINLTFVEAKRSEFWTPHVPRDWASLMQRYARLRASFNNIERLAKRRAARMKRERAANPLRLDAPHQSTSPALCAVEANDRCVASTSALHWGRWIARPCAQDGGGRAHARGPPSAHFPGIQNNHLSHPATETAPARPYPSALTVAVMNPPPSTLRPSGAAYSTQA